MVKFEMNNVYLTCVVWGEVECPPLDHGQDVSEIFVPVCYGLKCTTKKKTIDLWYHKEDALLLKKKLKKGMQIFITGKLSMVGNLTVIDCNDITIMEEQKDGGDVRYESRLI